MFHSGSALMRRHGALEHHTSVHGAQAEQDVQQSPGFPAFLPQSYNVELPEQATTTKKQHDPFVESLV